MDKQSSEKGSMMKPIRVRSGKWNVNKVGVSGFGDTRKNIESILMMLETILSL